MSHWDKRENQARGEGKQRAGDRGLRIRLRTRPASGGRPGCHWTTGWATEKRPAISPTAGTSRRWSLRRWSVGGLVESPSPARADRPRSTGGNRGGVLSSAGGSSHGGGSHVTISPAIPGRFNLYSNRYPRVLDRPSPQDSNFWAVLYPRATYLRVRSRAGSVMFLLSSPYALYEHMRTAEDISPGFKMAGWSPKTTLE
jgi:hypothetical protein